MLQFYKYPQTDLNQQNLDWMIQTIKDLQKQIGDGGVQVVSTYAEMTNVNVIYVYVGTEPGMNTDHWYYYDTPTSSWVDGGSWGGASVTLPLAISDGGTGSTTVAGARNALGLGNTSGALPIANGGTGKTTAAAAYTALGGGAAGKLDTVDIAHGGTGATTVDAARNALGLGNTSGALPVANGGTGSQTAAAARSALGITPAAIGAEPAIDVLPVSKGGTGENTLANAKNAFGLFSSLDISYFSVAANSSVAIPLVASESGIIFVLSVSSGARDFSLYRCSGAAHYNGSLQIGASGLSLDDSVDGTLTINNTSAAAARIIKIASV